MARSGSENPLDVMLCGPASCPAVPTYFQLLPPSAERQFRVWFAYPTRKSPAPGAAVGFLYTWVVPACAETMIAPSCATTLTGSPPARALSMYSGAENETAGAFACGQITGETLVSKL